MSSKTRAKGDAHAGSDASSVRVTQVFADLEESLTETDPESLAHMPEPDEAETMAGSEQEPETDIPEIYHDNICDPADIRLGSSDVTDEANSSTPVESGKAYTGMPKVDVLREKITNTEDTQDGLSERFILDGHSYL